MMGNWIFRSPYCVVNPWNVCLSVLQMPENSIRTSTRPGAGSGKGHSRSSYRPGSSRVAARTESRTMGPCLERIVYVHGPKISRRLIDCVKDDHVTMALLAVRFHIFVLQNRGREGVEFERKFVDWLEAPVEFASGDLPRDCALEFKGKSGSQTRPAFRALNKEERRHRGRVGGTALHLQPALEVQAETDALFDITETGRVMAPRMGRRFDRVLIDKPARRIHAINAKIHHRTATRHCGIQKPVDRNPRYKEFAERSVHHVDAAERSVPNQLFQKQRGRLEIFSVSGHQAHVVMPASLDHLHGLCRDGSERLFAEHVLSGLCRTNRHGGVLSGRRGDVYCRDLRISQTSTVFIQCVPRPRPEFSRPFRSFLFVATYQRHEFGLFAVCARRT